MIISKSIRELRETEHLPTTRHNKSYGTSCHLIDTLRRTTVGVRPQNPKTSRQRSWSTKGLRTNYESHMFWGQEYLDASTYIGNVYRGYLVVYRLIPNVGCWVKHGTPLGERLLSLDANLSYHSIHL